MNKNLAIASLAALCMAEKILLLIARDGVVRQQDRLHSKEAKLSTEGDPCVPASVGALWVLAPGSQLSVRSASGADLTEQSRKIRI